MTYTDERNTKPIMGVLSLLCALAAVGFFAVTMVLSIKESNSFTDFSWFVHLNSAAYLPTTVLTVLALGLSIASFVSKETQHRMGFAGWGILLALPVTFYVALVTSVRLLF